MPITLIARPIDDPFAATSRAAIERLLTRLDEAGDGDVVGVEFDSVLAVERGNSLDRGSVSHLWFRTRREGMDLIEACPIDRFGDAQFDALAPALLRLQLDGWNGDLGDVAAPLDIQDLTSTDVTVTILRGAIVIARSGWCLWSRGWKDDDNGHRLAHEHLVVAIPARQSAHEALFRNGEIRSAERFLNMMQDYQVGKGPEFRISA